MSATITRHLRITGRVQGVGYRWNMAKEAERLGVNGWVRNRLDGSVEAVVSGRVEAALALVEWARQGPRGAHVERVVVSVVDGTYERFVQRDTR